MKKLLLIVLVAAILPACSTMTPEQRDRWNEVGVRVASTAAEIALNSAAQRLENPDRGFRK